MLSFESDYKRRRKVAEKQYLHSFRRKNPPPYCCRIILLSRSGNLLFQFERASIKLVIRTALLNQFVMTALFDDSAVV